MKVKTVIGNYLENRDTIINALHRRAEKKPEALAYWVEGQTLSYGGLVEAVQLTAANLIRFGLKKADVGILVLPTSLSAVIGVFALQYIGAIPVILSPDLPDELVLKRVDYTGGRLVIAPGDRLQRLKKRRDEKPRPAFLVKSPDELNNGSKSMRPVMALHSTAADPAYLQFTSGTMGEPKAAVVSHGNLASFLKLTGELFSITDRDIFVSWLPLYHDLGLVRYLFGPIFFGGPVYLLSPSIGSLRRWMPIISEKRGTITSGPDFAYRMVTRMAGQDELDLSCLRIATNGGETVRASTIKDFEKRFSLPGIVLPTYGLAEATLGVSSLAPGEPVVIDGSGNVSCGRPYNDLEVRIIGSKNECLENGQAGEIIVRGATVFSGYLEDIQKGRKGARDQWLHTGDIGILDGQGNLFVLGRKRAMIKRAGTLIIPREVEEAVDTADGVRFSAAIGVRRHLGRSEAVVIVAEIKAEYGKTGVQRKKIVEAIVEKIRKTVGFSPGDVVLVAPRTIPLTANGKIRYGRLREVYLNGDLERLDG